MKNFAIEHQLNLGQGVATSMLWRCLEALFARTGPAFPLQRILADKREYGFLEFFYTIRSIESFTAGCLNVRSHGHPDPIERVEPEGPYSAENGRAVHWLG